MRLHTSKLRSAEMRHKNVLVRSVKRHGGRRVTWCDNIGTFLRGTPVSHRWTQHADDFLLVGLVLSMSDYPSAEKLYLYVDAL